MKKKFSVGTGVPSILMIFVVLALTTFAVLSFASARADYNLTEKNCKYIMSYYEADKEAQTVISQIDAIIAKSNAASDDFNLMSELSALNKGITIELDDNGHTLLKYSVRLNEQQNLNVALRLGSDSGARYTIAEYSVSRQATDSGVQFEDESAGWWQGN